MFFRFRCSDGDVAARDFRIANLEANAEAAAFVGRGLAEKLQKLETLQKDVSVAETDHTLSLVASLRRLEGLPLRYGAATGAGLPVRKVPLTRHAACTADDEASKEEIERVRMQLEEAHQKLRLKEQTKDEPDGRSVPRPGPKDATPEALLEEAVSEKHEGMQGATAEEGSREEELESKAAPVSSGAQVSQSTQTEADPAPESAEESGKAVRAPEPEAATECLELALLDSKAAAASEQSRRENTQSGIEKAERQEGKEGKEGKEEEEEEEEEEGKEGKEEEKEDEGLGEETQRGLLGSPEPGPSAELPMPEQHELENSCLLHQEAMDDDTALEELDVSDEGLQQWLRAVADTMASMREESASEAASSHEEGSRMLFLTAEAAYGHLGFRLTAPPGHFVYRCEEGSWADQVGLQQGDQLVQLQGMDVGLLPHALLQLALERHRPLELTFARVIPVFEALATLPEPRKPEKLGMDMLQSVLSVQPEEHALDEELCLPEPDLIAEDEKQSPLDSRSSTCMPLTLGEMVDFDAEDVGADSRHSFFLRSLADGTDYSRPPNRTLHDHHNSRMKGFLKAVSASSADLEQKVRVFRGGSADVRAQTQAPRFADSFLIVDCWQGFGVGGLVEDIAGSLSGLRARSQAPADTQEAIAATPSRWAEENLEDRAYAYPPSVEDDRALALAAVQKNCDAYPLLSLPMRYDREITLEAVRQKGGLLQYTSPVLQTDREVVGAAVQQSGAALRFAAPAKRNEVGLVRRAVTTTPEIFPFLPAEQKARRELASVAVARDGMLLSAVPALQDDKDIVLAAVKQNPAALQFASSSLRYDKDILRLCLGTPDG
eukprot:s4439_g4.t1